MDFETVVQSGLEIRDRTAYKSVRSDQSAVPQSGPASLLEIKEDLQVIHAATQARKKRQKSNREVVQHGGIITAENARLAINQQEAEKAARAAAKKVKNVYREGFQWIEEDPAGRKK
jgi:hypothetical protein